MSYYGYSNYGYPYTGYSNMGNNHHQGVAQTHSKRNQVQKTDVQQALNLLRDQIGTVFNVSERLLFSLGKIKDPKDFKFHAYSPDRLVEYDSDTVAYKLLILFKYLITFHEQMLEEFPYEKNRIEAFHLNLESAFTCSADEYIEKATSLGPEHQLEKQLLLEILHRLLKRQYIPLNDEFIARLKTAIKARSHLGPHTRTDHSGLMGFMHKTNDNLEDTLDYIRKNPHKQPNTGYEPATRDSSTNMYGAVNYIGNKQDSNSNTWTTASPTFCQDPRHRHAFVPGSDPQVCQQVACCQTQTSDPAANCFGSSSATPNSSSGGFFGSNQGQVSAAMIVEQQNQENHQANQGRAADPVATPHGVIPQPPPLSLLSKRPPGDKFRTTGDTDQTEAQQAEEKKPPNRFDNPQAPPKTDKPWWVF